MAHEPQRLVYTVPEAGRLLRGLGRNAAYDAARLLVVPKIPFHRMLGMTSSVTATPTVIIDASAKLSTAEVKGEDA